MSRLTAVLLFVTIASTGLAQESDFQNFDWKHWNSKTASPEMKRRVNEYLEELNGRIPNHLAGSSAEIKSLIINGNKITTIVYNYGSITRPNTLGNVADLVWNKLGYGYEFAPLVAAQVVNDNGDTLRIVDDGLWLQGQGDYDPVTGTKWGWLPKAGYSAPGQPDIAAWSHRKDVGGDLTRKPHSWPESFYNPGAGRYVWPAYLGNDASSPDEEVYFVMDDYTNSEFRYYPFSTDSTKRGLGLDMECRFFQFNNPVAEDIIFLVYRVTNKSNKTLHKVWFGMYGDPHVGGPNSFNDDLAGFYGPKDSSVNQRARNIVYAWDKDGIGDGGLPTGYFGFKFLESPTNSIDLKDNDDDGIIDESPFNDAGFFIDGINFPLNTGIADTNKYKRLYGSPKPRWSGDENGNWSLERDDVGLDGIPGTNDFGEGNGRPDIGYDANGNFTAEPNFGIRDVNESDQIGLTSFWALPFGNPNFPSNDPLFYQLMSADSIDINQTLFNTAGDNIFLYGSGPFELAPGGTQRFSIALLMGSNLQDLLLNSETSQRVLEANYQFAQPPPKPKLTAVAGDHRVTLYWDNVAEGTTDPLTATKDFEGYKIYRSQDPTFADVFTITDANGNPFLGRPFEQGGKPAQFDLVNQWVGLHPVEYGGRGVKYNLGTNSGLVHEYVDSSALNGITYYYAIASYDHGFDSLGTQLPPSESQIAILRNVITGEFTFDVNTASVTPGPLASGYIKAGVDHNGSALRIHGNSTGTINIKVLDDLSVVDNVLYSIAFDSTGPAITYNVHPEMYFTEKFTSRDTVLVPLLRKNLVPDSIIVRNATGNVVNPSAYRLDAAAGRIRGATPGSLPAGAQFEITYQYYTVFQSTKINGEDENPAFDGLRVYVKGAPLGIDSAHSGFRTNNTSNLRASVHKPLALPSAPFKLAPLDFEIRWNKTDRDARGKWLFPGDTVLNNNGRKVVVCPFRIVNVTDTSTVRFLVNNALSDSIWKPGREIVFITPPKYAPQSPIPVMVAVTFFPPVDTSAQIVYPPEGAVFDVKSSKPFAKGDLYQFTSKAVKYDAGTAKSMLDRIYVVPNPYVAYSSFEAPGATSGKRGENRLQFRNLPPQCTIRIYTMIGELVATIVKDDQTSIATWNVLSNEGQRLAYGVYIFHVEAPGVGEKIGRFALIK
jgi:hypothetical protein